MNDRSAKKESTAHATDLLRESLTEAQATVRAYDTKAQIVGVGYAFALGIVASTSDWFPKTTEHAIIPILVFWGIVMAPLFLFGYVLYPTRRTAPKVDGDTAASLERILYLDPDKHSTIDAIVAAAARSTRTDEFAYELLKVSKLRELKRIRFIRALIAAGFSFFALFAGHLIGTLG